ncbi:MAG: DUF748 domain-containing protein, partial [Enterobacterales bacterium]|nr:DUF748 domain-containing protein [Enterobacterales bacterium]
NMSLAEMQLLDNFTNPQVSQEYLATLNNLSISGIDFKPTELSIIDIKLSALESHLSINEQGLNVANWFQASPDTATESTTTTETITATETETESAATPLQLTLESFTLEPANIRIQESLTGSEYEHQIEDLSLTIQNISNDTAPDTAPSTIKYTTGLGDSGSLNGEGTFKALPDNLEVDITGKLKDMNLVGVSHLATRFIGYRIDSGLLNIDYRVSIKDQKIDSNLETLLEKFALAKLEESEQNPLNEDLGLPLPMALNLLRDSDNNIELDLPITGDVNSPDFSVSGIISVVMVKAIKQAVIYNYSPLGMLSMASGIVDLATALRFDPVVFTPLSVEISEKGTEQLQKIITLMQKKPKVKMIICGVATEMDRPAQQAVEIAPGSANQAITEPSAATAEPPVVQPIVDPMSLIALAKQRQDSVINYIVSNGNIDKARLIGCNIKVAKKKDAKPVVKISI